MVVRELSWLEGALLTLPTSLLLLTGLFELWGRRYVLVGPLKALVIFSSSFLHCFVLFCFVLLLFFFGSWHACVFSTSIRSPSYRQRECTYLFEEVVLIIRRVWQKCVLWEKNSEYPLRYEMPFYCFLAEISKHVNSLVTLRPWLRKLTPRWKVLITWTYIIPKLWNCSQPQRQTQP